MAVFAARLAPPLDDVSVLDLARWQRRMQFLAPRAGQVAIAISLTQFAVPALGFGLLLISLLAVTAADLRIAGRLSALQMEVDSAKKFSDHAQKEFERLKSSFRNPLLAKVEGDGETSWNKASALVILPTVALVTAETFGLLILWQGEGVFRGYGLTDYFGFYLWFAFALWGGSLAPDRVNTECHHPRSCWEVGEKSQAWAQSRALWGPFAFRHGWFV
ncbi:hypothetical protein ACQQCD_07420 [Pseudarthrobacter sp. J1763]|uniref:hypothetical protein n=1 Tax=Pseudarthrobacter sp. J1763 TaxID=3420445 RepID=UPI003D2B9691